MPQPIYSHKLTKLKGEKHIYLIKAMKSLNYFSKSELKCT